ncbi:DNA-directed DNA polymerase [Pseudomonas syringae pv. primulae]|uniref:DNA-directed DNA polymerase n=1 Tax=Pseudomonas syringae pv. primulae TaxID=251707 RepID=A0A3M3XYY6_9PSED|nr:DNA-directed DNA polymerase [Pseudomonas syringae pv. primulae]RMU32905.1 DNA-directed DNA polymerase [Pseudomonas syringae pv. primulae]
MNAHLEAMNIRTAMDLATADPRTLRDRFSVVIEKTARELAGTSCLELGEAAPPKQEICCSRMFGKRLTTIQPIKEAVATPDSKIVHALGLIDTAEHPTEVRFATAYASGYIEVLYDAKLIAAPAVQCYRDDAQARRARRLTELGVGHQG